MKERDLHKLLRRGDEQEDKALYDKLKNTHPELGLKSCAQGSTERAQKPVFFQHVVAFAPLAAVIVFAVAMLVVSFSNDSHYASGSTDFEPSTDYHGVFSYWTTMVKCTAREYAAINNQGFLYYDGDEYICMAVTEYSNFQSQEFAGLQANYYHPASRMDLMYFVYYENNPLGFLKDNIDACNEQTVVDDCVVKWGADKNVVYGNFGYGDYEYYVSVRSGDTAVMLDFVNALLASGQ